MSEFWIPTIKKKVTLTNLVPDSSFENIASNWNVTLASPTDTAQFKDGLQSLKFEPGGLSLAATQTAVTLIYGHKYYGREYIKTAGQLDAGDCRFEMIGAVDGAEVTYIFGWNRGNYPDWTINSGIVTIDRQGLPGFGIRTFTSGGTVNAWVDSLTVIDLTEACGAGNEPSKEWCDANIPWFDGSMELQIPLNIPEQAQVENLAIAEGNVVEIKDASGRVLWKLADEVSPFFRPTADVSNDFGVYPGGTAAYLCVGEKVADGDATYIYPSAATSRATLVFSANLPIGKTVSEINFVVVGKSSSEKAVYPFIRPGFVFDGVHYCTAASDVGITSSSYVTRSVPIVDAIYDTASNEWTRPPKEQASISFPSALTKHIEASGGKISMEVPVSCAKPSKGTAYFTQMYIEVIFND